MANHLSALDCLKAACEKKPFRSFDDLMPGEYIINEFSQVDTQYGNRLRISMENGTVFMFLPERFNMDEEGIKELNSSPKIMVYRGKDVKAKNRLLLDFQDLQDLADQLSETSESSESK